MKVGAYSMSNEIRTHLEATGLRYFTASRAKNISWHIRKNMNATIQHVCINCVHILYVRVPDSVPYNTELCTRLAGGNGLISATPGGFHQTLPNLIHLANQEGF